MRFCSQCAASYPDSYRVCPQDGSALVERGALAPGATIRGKYRILEKLGAGGMATVYKARHLRFEEVWAVKVISEQCLAEPALVERFQREAAIARRLRHENAVAIHDVDETEDGRPFIAMEFVAGRNLRAVLASEGPFAPARAIGVVAQVADALAAAHALGIVHRDIKPDNIMLCANDRVKVLDFGIARLAAEARTTLTRTGSVMGTPDYMSPEQAMGLPGEKIDARTDIYSLGIVMYELLTGELPFQSETPTGMLLQHIQAIPQAPHLKRPELNIPTALSEVLLKALAKDPAERFSSVQAMAAALRAAAGAPARVATAAAAPDAGLRPTVIARPVEATRPAVRPLPPPESGSGWGVPLGPMAVLGVILVFAAAGVGYYLFGRPRGVVETQPTQSQPLERDKAEPKPAPTQSASEPAQPVSKPTGLADATKPSAAPTERQSASQGPNAGNPAGPDPSVLWPAPARAEEPVYEIGGDVTRPMLVSAPKPAYTDEARNRQIQGEVRLKVVVGADGSVAGIVTVEQSLPYGLTENAIAAARQWRFTPATRFGQPVAVYQRLALNFTLY